MKKYLFLLLAAIFCLPNISFAQNGPMLINVPREYQPVDPSFGIWNSMITNSNKSLLNKPNKSSKKPRKTTTPITKEDLVAEMIKDPETGQTTIRWNNGAVYVGETYYGEIKGMGTMTFADGAKYHGQWRFDRFHGVGSMVCADGSKYTGEWQLGKPHGKGTFINPEGVAFIGEFYDGAPNGKGIIQDVDGRKYTARWKHGELKVKSIKPLEEK